MAPPLRHPSRRTPPPRSPSRSPSPDPELVRFLDGQKRPCSPETEAFRNKRIAAAGVFNVKSRHQKDKEEAERKKVEEEERAAKAYKEFVRDMQGDDREDGEKKNAFVRAGSSSTYEPSSRHQQTGASDATYPKAPRAMRGESESVNAVKHVRGVDNDDEEDLAEASRRREVSTKRKGAMGSFLGELQRDQAEREERLRSKVSEGTSISTLLAQETGGSSSRPWDSNDSLSHNICVLNLPANVTETTFGEYFSRYGDVASVKIMWSRTSDDLIAPNLRSTKSAGATGFVNYMNRSDAEEAYRKIEGSEWMGSLLRTGWGKALRRPLQALHHRPAHSRDIAEVAHKDSTKGDRHTRSSRSPRSRNHRRVREKSPSAKSSLLPWAAFEDEGEASLYSSDTEEDSEWDRLREQGRTKVLGKAARRRLEAMLRGITLRRERIARVMVFAIDHAAAAETVCNTLVESLLQPTTPISRKLARLYVVSDILHNSSVSASNAWRYRSLFESELDRVFLHWGDVANSFAGRIKRESCKEMARNILNVWENWLVYENSKLSAWREHIDGEDV